MNNVLFAARRREVGDRRESSFWYDTPRRFLYRFSDLLPCSSSDVLLGFSEDGHYCGTFALLLVTV